MENVRGEQVMNYLVLAALLLLTGCSSVKEKEVTVKEVEVVKQNTPKALLEKCIVPTPPDKDVYLKSDFTNKENLLTEYIGKLLSALRGCNEKLDSVKKTQ